jgi:outer membrane receptor for monomeric catechols
LWRPLPLLLTVLLAASAGGQTGRASLSGVVRDTGRVPHALVQVSVAGVSTATDSAGRFALFGLTAGPAQLTARRLGFEPHAAALTLVDDRADTVTIVLALLAADLPGVTTTAMGSARLVDFERHRMAGAGVYLDRQQIEARHAHSLSDILRRTPGVRISSDRSGRAVLRMGRAMGGRDCPPDYFIDGVRAQFFSVDDMPVSDIEALEIYRGPSGLPPEYNTRLGNPACGTIVIWTRVPG